MATARDLYKLLASSAVIQAIGLGATMLLGIVLARFLGPSQYGHYGVAMSLISIAIIPAQFGLPVFATREAAATLAPSAHGPGTVVRWFVSRSTLIALSAACVLFLGFQLFGQRLGSESMADLAAESASLVWLSAFVSVLSALLRGLGGNIKGQSIDLILKPLLAVAIAYLLARTGHLNVAWALASQLVAVVLSIAVAA